MGSASFALSKRQWNSINNHVKLVYETQGAEDDCSLSDRERPLAAAVYSAQRRSAVLSLAAMTISFLAVALAVMLALDKLVELPLPAVPIIVMYLLMAAGVICVGVYASSDAAAAEATRVILERRTRLADENDIEKARAIVEDERERAEEKTLRRSILRFCSTRRSR